ncbi:Phage related conserved hypothetical protein [Bordetella parapertussis Bpp5]|uniref:DUF2514 family protein n=2 Tax=Bordetella parapertussis TaxID=519 RepID=K0M8S2_BORPB|nr:Phage related conserved hypothetical protein [Bordetella parapertussis Bpp5]
MENRHLGASRGAFFLGRTVAMSGPCGMGHQARLREWLAQATIAALEAVREEGRRRTAAVEKARDDAQELAAAAAANAVGARAERDRLRTHANALARAAVARDPDAADGSPTGASAVDLLAYMLSRVSGRAEALAGVADRARIAGLTCERAYEAVRGNVRP